MDRYTHSIFGVCNYNLVTSKGFFGKLPSFDELENPKINLATQLISSDGNNLGAYFYENRSNASYKDLPKI